METEVFKAVSALAGPIITVLVGWILKVLWDRIKELETKLDKVDAKLQEHYAKKDDFKDAIYELKEMFHKIMDKLDRKVDK